MYRVVIAAVIILSVLIWLAISFRTFKKERFTYGTPIHNAAAEGNLNALHRLLDAGANVNVRNTSGLTPLGVAVGNDPARPDVVRLLLKKHADIAAKDNWGSEPLSIAVLTPREQADSLLACQILLQNGASVNSQDRYGNTALIDAIRRDVNGDRRSVVLLLMQNGADRRIKNNAGETASSVATNRHRPDLGALINSDRVPG